MARRLIHVLLLGLVLSTGACSENGQADPARSGAHGYRNDAWITIKGQRVALEIVDTPQAMSRGLGGRDALPWGRGMLFIYEQPGFPLFWMRGMRFDIDIVWLRDGRIIDISHRVVHVPGENGPSVQPSELCDSVLEVPAGYASANGWRIGTPVRLERKTP